MDSIGNQERIFLNNSGSVDF